LQSRGRIEREEEDEEEAQEEQEERRGRRRGERILGAVLTVGRVTARGYANATLCSCTASAGQRLPHHVVRTGAMPYLGVTLPAALTYILAVAQIRVLLPLPFPLFVLESLNSLAKGPAESMKRQSPEVVGNVRERARLRSDRPIGE